MDSATTTDSSPAEALAAVLARKGMSRGLDRDLDIDPAAPPVASPVHRGVAHHCFRVAAPGQAPLFCKLPAADQAGLTDAAAAAEMAALAGDAAAAPAVAWFDAESAVLATHWLDGDWRYARVEDLRQPERLRLVFARLQALHRAPPPPGAARHDPRARLRRQDAILRDLPVERPPNYDWLLDQAASALDALKPEQAPAVPCHLGTIASNVMLGPEDALLLVDFDQAGLSEPLHDFGILLTEAFDFEDEWSDALAPHYGAQTDKAVHRARLWGLVDDLSWAQWALICHARAQRSEIEYFKYASWRFMRATLTAGDWSFERRLRQA